MKKQILNVKNSGAVSDSSITNIQYRAYNPYTTSFKCGDEIRIAIQQQELYVLPHESYIYIEGDVIIETTDDATPAERIAPNFVNNAAAFLFEEIRYELNGIQIDFCKNVGITSLLKVLWIWALYFRKVPSNYFFLCPLFSGISPSIFGK